MTTPSDSPLPAAAAGAFVAREVTEDEVDQTVGDDAGRDGRDSDGTPVGDADAEADARRTGGRFDES
jgi:hypothetical protein